MELLVDKGIYLDEMSPYIIVAATCMHRRAQSDMTFYKMCKRDDKHCRASGIQ